MMVAFMSMTKADPATPTPSWREHAGSAARPAEQARSVSIVPKDSIAANALAAVVAIMTFLAAVTSGGVAMVIGAASEWQSEIAREITIQVRPISGHDIEAEVTRAADIARGTRGVEDVRVYSRRESERLLEPWLGPGLSLDDLPVPRMIAVRVAPGAVPDIAALRETLMREVTGASLDDHRGWIDRMRGMARTAVAGGLMVFGLVLAATILSVTFATRGAMASNRPIVEVLHFVGAKDAYIARQFQRHFLTLGLKGGALGGGVAIVFLALAGRIGDLFVSTAGGAEASALFGSFSVGPLGYFIVVAEIILIALITAVTSRQVVIHTLRRMD
jgi:cell division transport system permease protein